MRHRSFFLGALNWVFWVGAKKLMLKKFMCFFGPLTPQVRLTKGYFGQFKGYIFAVLGHFCFLLVLGVVGHRGFTIILTLGFCIGRPGSL